jgi:hypothetical protein
MDALLLYLQSWLTEYFTTRDITMNEVLILKVGWDHREDGNLSL